MPWPPRVAPSGALVLVSVLVGAWYWSRQARRDARLVVVFAGALLGAFLGGKVVYLLIEGWQDWGQPDRWMRLAMGKTVLGALLGGYGGVELAKHLVAYRQPTGDGFALITPLGLVVGRIGCWLQGCCLGQVCSPAWYTLRDPAGTSRWPAVQVELAFNLAAAVGLFFLRRAGQLRGQHFHLYLIGYGVFRFLHEFLRATPRVAGAFSGYHLAALAIVALGLGRFLQRRAAARAGTQGPDTIRA